MINSITRHYPPTPKGHWLWGNLPEFQKDILGLFLNSYRQYGDIVRIRLGPRNSYFIAHPEDIKYVLQTNAKIFNKRTRGYRNLKPIFGDGLLTSEGEIWQEERQRTQPELQYGKVVAMFPTMKSAIQDMLEQWESFVRSGELFNIHAQMSHLALSVAEKALFGTGLNEEIDVVINSMKSLAHFTVERTARILNFPKFIPLPQNRQYHQDLRNMESVVDKIIRNYAQTSGPKQGFLTMIMSGNKWGSDQCNMKGIFDEIKTLLWTGYDTTALAMTWTWYLLSLHPEIMDKLYHEIDTVLQGRTPQPEDLSKLKYTDQVLKEAMRLYPPGWHMPRVAVEDTEIRGYSIPKQSVIYISPYVTHRHADFWDNPDEFQPERFEKKVDLHPFAFFPFGGGPRRCVGYHFSMAEALLTMAMTAQKFRLHLVMKNPVGLNPLFTLHPREPIMMRLFQR